MHYAVLISCSFISPLVRRGQKDTELHIPCVAQLGFEAQGYQPFSESKKNDQSSSDFTISGWLFSWCHSEPPPVWHYCWESWLKLNYEPQGKVWTTFKTHLQTFFYHCLCLPFLFCYFLFTYTHTISEHTHTSLSLKTCIASSNGSNTNILLLTHTEFFLMCFLLVILKSRLYIGLCREVVRHSVHYL